MSLVLLFITSVSLDRQITANNQHVVLQKDNVDDAGEHAYNNPLGFKKLYSENLWHVPVYLLATIK